MQRLGVAGAHRGLIGDDLPEAAPGDGAEGVRRRHVRADIDFGGLLDLELPSSSSSKPRSALVFTSSLSGTVSAKDAGEAKQLCRLSRA